MTLRSRPTPTLNDWRNFQAAEASARAPIPRETVPKKERESALLRQFWPWYPEFPTGEIVEGESPDFMVVSPTGFRVGIELTEVYRRGGATAGSPDRRQESLRTRFAGTAEKRYYDEYALPAYAYFSWPSLEAEGRFLNRKLIEDLAGQAARLIGERLVEASRHEFPEVNSEVDIGGTPLARSLDSVSTRPSSFVDTKGWGSPWGYSSSFYRVTATGVDLRKAVAAKNLKADEYRRKCDEVWLLLCLTGGPTSFDDVEPGLGHVAISSDFDRVVMLCTGSSANYRTLTLFRR